MGVANRLLLILLFTLGGSSAAAQTPGLLVEPYLQSPTPASMVIGWETQGSTQSQVEYGLTTALGQVASGTSINSGGGAIIHHVERDRIAGANALLLPDGQWQYRQSDLLFLPLIQR